MKIKSPIGFLGFKSMTSTLVATRWRWARVAASLTVGFSLGAPSAAMATPPAFVPADTLSESRGVDGFVVEGDPAGPGFVHVLSGELFSSIERHSLGDCVTVLTAVSAITGDQAELTIGMDGVGELTADGVVWATIAQSSSGLTHLLLASEHSENRALQALVVAANDTNLSIRGACQETPRFVVPIDQGFGSGDTAWFVETAVVSRDASNGTHLAFSARRGETVELWQADFMVAEDSITLRLQVDGALVICLTKSDVDLRLESHEGTAVAAISDPIAPPAMAAMFSLARPRLDTAEAVARAVATALSPMSEDEVQEGCRQLCNDGLPYASNCETLTEKLDCCATDAQRALCRRNCFSSYYCNDPDTSTSLWWCAWQGAKQGALFDIDLAFCAAAFMRSWKD